MQDDILALTKLRRSRPNLDRINEQLSEVRELADVAEAASTLAADIRTAIDELTGCGAEGNPLVPWFDDAVEAANVFDQSLPQEEVDIEGSISEAEQLAEEYESSLDDRDLTADDRQEIWDNLLDALTNLADAM